MNSSAFTVCPGCGVKLPDRNLGPAERYNAAGECLEAYYDLTCWTLVQQDAGFVHQHAVDAYAAQHVGERMRPITAVFALIGLYLAVERGYTGRQVQLVHMKIGRRRDWPRLEPPKDRGELTVMDILLAATDAKKEEALMRWTAAVWEAWEDRHRWVRETTKRVLYGVG
ncbi:MAG TPA: DUF5946 family protein [Methanoculleus sp.]|uniref:DUF5946 family protein n=1 Tax=Methanoculleus sp. TaxID=90427 RepID=UPI002B87A7A3|nr:DUF5946 family protein [Methanoculleus sp.]